MKDFDVYYSRGLLLAALLPGFIIYKILTLPFAVEEHVILYKCLAMIPFLLISAFIIVTALYVKIRIRGDEVEVIKIFSRRHFILNEITSVKQFESYTGSKFVKVYIGSKCVLSTHDHLVNYELMIKRFSGKFKSS